jgi:hypothetical protein
LGLQGRPIFDARHIVSGSVPVAGEGEAALRMRYSRRIAPMPARILAMLRLMFSSLAMVSVSHHQR